MNWLWVERWYPAAIAGVATALWLPLGCVINQPHDVFNAAITLASIVVGFLATAMSIVLASDSKVMQDLRTSGYIADLVRYLREPFGTGLVLAGVALLGYFMPDDASKHRALAGTLLFLSVALCLGLLRIGNIMLKFLRYPPAAATPVGPATPPNTPPSKLEDFVSL